MARQMESRLDPIKLVARLERKHTELKQEVKRIDSQLHLSAEEEVALARLKKEKLLTKDALEQARDSVPPPAPQLQT